VVKILLRSPSSSLTVDMESHTALALDVDPSSHCVLVPILPAFLAQFFKFSELFLGLAIEMRCINGRSGDLEHRDELLNLFGRHGDAQE